MLAYLRLIANPQDTVSLQRIINVPTRKIGEKTFGEFLRWAQQEGMQPVEALARIEEHPTLATASKRALTGFSKLLADLRQKSRELQLPALLDHLLAHSGYAQELRDGTEEGEERWNNVLELRRVAEDFSEIDPETALALFLENVALVSGADTAQTGENGTLAEERAEEGRRDAHHTACGEGAGVPGGLPRRAGGGHPAALALAGEPARAGGGAAAGVRGHHAGDAPVVPGARVPPVILRWQQQHAGALALPRRDSRRTDGADVPAQPSAVRGRVSGWRIRRQVYA